MVLHTRGRVGSRRFFERDSEGIKAGRISLFFVYTFLHLSCLLQLNCVILQSKSNRFDKIL